MCDHQDSFLCFQISIVYHIQKTPTNYVWPARGADCLTSCLGTGKTFISGAVLLWIRLYWVYHKLCWVCFFIATFLAGTPCEFRSWWSRTQIFWSNTILSDQNVCLLSYNVIEEGFVKRFCLIKMIEQPNFVPSYVFLLDHMICERPFELPCSPNL